jgi:dihydrodipicolinate synthase/N-acetylneuraminate lyase
MPLFFRYEQEDLRAYCAHVSRAVRAPCLLYDLPDFTNALARETAIALMREEEFVTGLKDSSGREANIPTIPAARADRPWTLYVGDDRLLLQGLVAGWDGAISGVAGFCPELLVALARSFDREAREEAARLQQLLDELVEQITVFPAPWGVRIGLATRGLGTGPLPLPLSDVRRQQIRRFQEWFRAWLPQVVS